MSTFSRMVGSALVAAAIAAACIPAARAASSADERAAALDNAIPAAMGRAFIPGAIVGIWQDGREPYVRAFGVRDTATGEPMAPELYMRIGSTSKTFTVTAVLMLADRGKLGLDDPIDRYVEGVPSGNQITLRQLAAMRSGLYDYGNDTSTAETASPVESDWCLRDRETDLSCHEAGARITLVVLLNSGVNVPGS
jgi:D-alanyl-D-alanine carboxypeptidase